MEHTTTATYKGLRGFPWGVSNRDQGGQRFLGDNRDVEKATGGGRER